MNRRILCLIATLPVLSAAPNALAQTRLLEIASDRYIEVAGQASVSVTPDFARVTLGVTMTAKEAREAIAANAKAVNALIAVIKGEGVAGPDIQTSSFSISPEMTNPAPGAPAARTIQGYTVSNMVTATVRDISRLGALIDKAVAAGANAIYGIAYGENDPSALLDKARPLALADARRRAEIYANAGGAKIGRLMTLAEEGGAAPVPFGRAYATATAAPTPVEAGQDKLTVAVTAVFELTP